MPRLAYAQAWLHTTVPVLVAFRTWTDRYITSPAATRSGLESEGITLARARRSIIAELIKSDPERALSLTVPAAVRAPLPATVLAELETRVAGRGDFLRLYATPAPEPVNESAREIPCTERRVAFINGITYTAHAYGRREPQFAKHGASLHGIALDGELALHESPVHLLETDPAAAAPHVGEAFGRPWEFASTEPLQAFERQLVAAEDAAGTRVASPDEPTRAADAPTSRTVGRLRLLVIRIDFSDFPGATITPEAMQGMMDREVRGYYEDASYGQHTFTTDVTSKVYRLPRTGSSYALANDVYPLHSDARTLARADYDVDSYNRVIVVFSALGPSRVPGSRFDYFAGLAGGDFVWIMLPTPFWDYIAHELGHTHGLPHANLWVSNDANPASSNGRMVGSDHYDIMGGPAPSAVREDPRRHFNQYYKNKLGWLPDRAVTPVTTSGTYRIYCFDHRDALAGNQPLALQVFRDGVRWYWLGYRRAFSNSTSTPQADGLCVLWNRGATSDSLLLDIGASQSAIYDGTLPLDTTLTDTEHGITIRPTARGGSGATQYIDVAITVPSNPPSLLCAWGRDNETNVPAGLTNLQAIAAGERHVLALKSDGTLVTWGENTRRQLDLPSARTNVVAIAANRDVSGLVRADGTVAVWGDPESPVVTALPSGLSGVRQLALGDDHALALKTDGTVVAWGSNQWSQTSVPASLKNVASVAAGSLNSTALGADGTVTTWGSFYDGSTRPPANLTGVQAISAYYGHVLALKNDGTVVSWGLNSDGQLDAPSGLLNVAAVSAGKYYSMVLKADGTIVMWGRNDYGQRTVPAGLPRAYRISAGAAASFALIGSEAYFTRQPLAQNLVAGASLELSVGVSATGTPGYQWRRNGVALPGATSATLTIRGAAVSDSGSYDVVVTDNGKTAASAAAVVNIFPVLAIATQPRAQNAELGGRTTLSVITAGGGPLSYQWRKNGTAIAGATTSTLTFNAVSATDGGTYDVSITDGATALTSAAAALSVVPAARISNLSIRTNAGTGAQTLIVGFVVGGSAPKQLLIRGVGPALASFGLGGVLADPKLELYSGATKISENDNWIGNPQVSQISTQVGAFSLGSATSRDAAIYSASTAPGGYSAQISGVGSSTGTVLAEIYDASSPATFAVTTPRLLNVSARTFVGTNSDLLIAGFTIAGVLPKNILVRAIGPTLGAFGVNGVLADPKLELYRGSMKMAENDDWSGATALADAFTSIGAFGLSPASKDAALLTSLDPGSYTVQVSGVANTTGVALVEIYEVP